MTNIRAEHRRLFPEAHKLKRLGKDRHERAARKLAAKTPAPLVSLTRTSSPMKSPTTLSKAVLRGCSTSGPMCD
jgi:hypothetical protein